MVATSKYNEANPLQRNYFRGNILTNFILIDILFTKKEELKCLEFL